MASPSTVITEGFGSFGSVNLLPTFGFGIGSAGPAVINRVEFDGTVVTRKEFSGDVVMRSEFDGTVCTRKVFTG